MSIAEEGPQKCLRDLCHHWYDICVTTGSVFATTMSPLCHHCHTGWRLIAPTGVSGKKATATGLERSPNIVHGCAFPKQLAVSERWLSDGRSDHSPQQVVVNQTVNQAATTARRNTFSERKSRSLSLTNRSPLYPSGWLLPHDDKGRCVGVTSVRHSASDIQPEPRPDKEPRHFTSDPHEANRSDYLCRTLMHLRRCT